MSTFFSDEADISSAFAAVATFFSDVKGEVSNQVTWSFPSSGDVIDSATGTLVGAWTETPIANITGSAAGSNRAAGVGVRISWESTQIYRGRRVKGATFLTELGTGSYSPDGTLDSVSLGEIRDAADTLAATGLLRIWTRPDAQGSAVSTVSSAVVPDRITALRSRRF